MHKIQLELGDEIVEKLGPYRDRIPELIELGLQIWQERERQDRQDERNHLLQALGKTGKVHIPRPYTDEEPYVRRTPISVTGKPVSQLVVEQRGTV